METKYFIIYDDNEETKATPNKKQFLESLLYTMCYESIDDISKDDIYFNMITFENDSHDGTMITLTIKTKYCKMTYKKINY